MTFRLKCLLRGGERDNEEAIIGTQLRFGTMTAAPRRLAESEGR
jgi:hypothetical protein